MFVAIDHLIRTVSSKQNWSVKEADKICISANGLDFGVGFFLYLTCLYIMLFVKMRSELMQLQTEVVFCNSN